MVNGLDSASDLTNVVMPIKNAGYTFVIRYYSSSSNSWKILSTSESSAIANAGLKRVVVFENGNSDSYFSAAQGRTDASTAISLAKARGQSSGSAIYFAVDYDASESGLNSQIKSYFKEVKSAITNAGYKVGVYGSGRTCRIIKSLGLATYSWLAMSPGWAEHSSYTSWNIKQVRESSVSGVTIDIDNATSLTSIGAW